MLQELQEYVKNVELMFNLTDNKKFRFEHNYKEVEGFDGIVALMGNQQRGHWSSIFHLFIEEEHPEKIYLQLGLYTTVDYKNKILSHLMRDNIFNPIVSYKTNNMIRKSFKNIKDLNLFLSEYVFEYLFEES